MEWENRQKIIDYNDTTMKSDADDVRYSLENQGSKMLYVFGVNPSTATDQKTDPTIWKIVRFAEINGFDGFVMMNLYPLRSTNPYNLPKEINKVLHQKNLAVIKEIMGNNSHPVVLFTFGNSINAAPYLRNCLRDIVAILQPLCPKWKQIGNLTKKGNPRHPSRASYSLELQDFDVTRY